MIFGNVFSLVTRQVVSLSTSQAYSSIWPPRVVFTANDIDLKKAIVQSDRQGYIFIIEGL